MNDKRRNKRMDMNVILRINNLSLEDEKKGLNNVEIHTFNISRDGMGFTSEVELPEDGFFDTDVEIWTKETFHAIIKIVRKSKLEHGWEYGCVFLGLGEMDAYRIDVYQLSLENGMKS